MDTRRAKADGLYPIVRITYDKTTISITTGVRVREEHWGGNRQLVTKSSLNFQKLNQL
ncbi:MAG: Arm DNA-binding domain-containing protein [Daejeonella sp.]